MDELEKFRLLNEELDAKKAELIRRADVLINQRSREGLPSRGGNEEREDVGEYIDEQEQNNYMLDNNINNNNGGLSARERGSSRKQSRGGKRSDYNVEEQQQQQIDTFSGFQNEFQQNGDEFIPEDDAYSPPSARVSKSRDGRAERISSASKGKQRAVQETKTHSVAPFSFDLHNLQQQIQTTNNERQPSHRQESERHTNRDKERQPTNRDNERQHTNRDKERQPTNRDKERQPTTRDKERAHTTRNQEKPLPTEQQQYSYDSDEDSLAVRQLGAEASQRYLLAKLRVLKEELRASQVESREKDAKLTELGVRFSEISEREAKQVKVNTNLDGQVDKLKKSLADSNERVSALESQLSTLKKETSLASKQAKHADVDKSNREARLHRALEETERLKAALKEAQQEGKEGGLTARKKSEKLETECKRLERVNTELLGIIRKQMRLVDVLKRSKVHLEAVHLLGFTEAEFSRTLELGDKL